MQQTMDPGALGIVDVLRDGMRFLPIAFLEMPQRLGGFAQHSRRARILQGRLLQLSGRHRL
jgi:hypothetical protein